MNMTKRDTNAPKMAVDLPELQAMLCCGKTTALRIAKESGAGFNIGRRRLYNVEKIRAYMDALTVKETASA